MQRKYFKNTPNNIIDRDETISMIENQNALDFHRSLPMYRPTPLVHLANLSKKYDIGNIWVKDESHRFGLNAFKVLGTAYAIHLSLEKNPDIQSFCTATDGNHGRAVAWAASLYHKESVVIVPKATTAQRINAIAKEGAKVLQINGNYDEACQKAETMVKANNWVLIQDMAWEGYIEIPALIMAGYLTLFKELEEKLHPKTAPNIDLVFLQAGVGSLAAAGIYYYLDRYGEKRPKIIIVEPEEADGILLSFENNKISTSKGTSNTIMAGLNCGTPSLGAWNLLKNGADYVMKIHDTFAEKAIRELYFPTGTDTRIISGESGAAGFAGFLALMQESSFKPIKEELGISDKTNVLFINTEGNTDKNSFERIIRGAI